MSPRQILFVSVYCHILANFKGLKSTKIRSLSRSNRLLRLPSSAPCSVLKPVFDIRMEQWCQARLVLLFPNYAEEFVEVLGRL